MPSKPTNSTPSTQVSVYSVDPASLRFFGALDQPAPKPTAEEARLEKKYGAPVSPAVHVQFSPALYVYLVQELLKSEQYGDIHDPREMVADLLGSGSQQLGLLEYNLFDALSDDMPAAAARDLAAKIVRPLAYCQAPEVSLLDIAQEVQAIRQGKQHDQQSIGRALRMLTDTAARIQGEVQEQASLLQHLIDAARTKDTLLRVLGV